MIAVFPAWFTGELFWQLLLDSFGNRSAGNWLSTGLSHCGHAEMKTFPGRLKSEEFAPGATRVSIQLTWKHLRFMFQRRQVSPQLFFVSFCSKCLLHRFVAQMLENQPILGPAETLYSGDKNPTECIGNSYSSTKPLLDSKRNVRKEWGLAVWVSIRKSCRLSTARK